MAPNASTSFTQAALARVDAFIATHPEISRADVPQPGQGSTNRVIFARRSDGLIVFKVFCTPDRKARETFGLRHWAGTGLVPHLLYDVDDLTVVTSFIPGTYLHTYREDAGEDSWLVACRETGRALAALTQVPLKAADRVAFETEFYEGLGPLEAYLGKLLELGRGITARDPDFGSRFWKDNLDFIERQLEPILSQPRTLYHQDVSNLHVQDGTFAGCFDLEMCRVGCAAMQLGAAAGMFRGQLQGWSAFREGWETGTGTRLSHQERCAAAAANHLLAWREISRYLSYDGTPGSGYDWASPADPVHYRHTLETANALFDVDGS